ncbi:MAG TPA: monofunctional biosynthetic peptidoglycan transglycosylase [Chitinophagaceae bacterium]
MVRARKKKSLLRRILLRTLKILLILFITSTVYLLLCKWVWPPLTATQLVNYAGGYGLKRDYVSWDNISPHVKLAAIASEDQLFPVHNGFDWIAIEKSLDGKTTKRKKKRARGSGASTISQQTAKNVFLWQGSGVFRYIRKAPEFYFTKMIEWTWGKKRILEVYLNTIEMGPGIFGIEAAARHYYQKSAKQLSREEAATIIACLPNPKKYTVKPMSRWVSWKRAFILRQMNNISTDKRLQQLIR